MVASLFGSLLLLLFARLLGCFDLVGRVFCVGGFVGRGWHIESLRATLVDHLQTWVGKRTQRQDSRQQEVNKVVLAVDDVGT